MVYTNSGGFVFFVLFVNHKNILIMDDTYL